MKFVKSEPDLNFDLLKLVSEGGRWELGLRSMMFGARVRLGLAGCQVCQLDYCAGADPLFQIELLNAVRIILLKVPEDSPDCVVEHMFPGYSVKPINLDPTCWTEIQSMRDRVMIELNITDHLPLS